MNGLEYGSISFGDLGERFPEVLSGMTARRAGVDYGRLAAAYLGVLKGVRKLAAIIKTSKGAVYNHFANVPSIAEALDLERGINSNTDQAIVPVALRGVVRPKLHVTPTVALGKVDSKPQQWFGGWQPEFCDSDLCRFYSTHLKFIASILQVLLKYVPVLMLYGIVVGIILMLFILASNPDALFDLMLLILSNVPQYFGFFVKRVLARFAQRVATAFVPGELGNATSFNDMEPPNSTIGLLASFTMMYLAMLWRAPRA